MGNRFDNLFLSLLIGIAATSVLFGIYVVVQTHP
jgi:hypothetical protein